MEKRTYVKRLNWAGAKKEIHSLSFDPKVWSKVVKEARARKISISWYVNELVHSQFQAVPHTQLKD